MTDQQPTEAQLHGALHSIMQEYITGQKMRAPTMLGNATDQTIRSRIASAVSGGYDYADTLHNIYLDYGYPATLTFFNFWNMYRRLGVAKRVVEYFPEQTWKENPTIEGSDDFNRELEKIVETFGLWRRVKGLDTRQRVGRYAGMFMRVADNKTPDKPIEGKLNGTASLVDMVPLYESQLKPLETEQSSTSKNFGKPTMYQFIGAAPGSRNEKDTASFNIHPSRVVIAAEGSDNGGIYGVPALESIYNSLMDLRKILGGGGEGFYKNAAQNVVFDLKDGASANANKALLEQFNENYDDFAHNRMRRAMWTPGMETNVLQSALTSSDPFAKNTLFDISAGSGIAVSTLVGNQTGRLAGDQDSKTTLANVQARREDFGTEVTAAIIDWLVEWGVLPKSEYTVVWPDAMAPSKEEKLVNAGKMAEINQKAFQSGEQPPFTPEEIREEAGYDPEDMAEPDDGDDPDETLEDEENTAT